MAKILNQMTIQQPKSNPKSEEKKTWLLKNGNWILVII